MFKNATPQTGPVKRNKSYMNVVKVTSWLYLTIAIYISLAGGPTIFAFLFLMFAFLAGMVIFQNSDEGEQKAVAWAMGVFMVANALHIVSPTSG